MGDTLLWLRAAAAQPHAVLEREREREHTRGRTRVVGLGWGGGLYRATISHCTLLSHLLFKSPWPAFPYSFSGRSAWFALFSFPPTPYPDILVPYFPR